MKKHIVCFGDSNTHGYCAATGGRFDESQRWPCLLQEQLGSEYLVLESGQSGRTTCFDDPIHEALNGLDAIYSTLMTHEPVDLLIIMLGTNDTKERFGVSPQCIALGMKRLVEKAQSVKDCWPEGKSNIFIVAPQNIDPRYYDTEVGGTMGRGCAEKSRQLAAEYEKIARLLGVHFLDANQVISAPTNTTDFMHLTAEGHAQLARALREAVRKLV